jgi:hypothetical protein
MGRHNAYGNNIKHNSTTIDLKHNTLLSSLLLPFPSSLLSYPLVSYPPLPSLFPLVSSPFLSLSYPPLSSSLFKYCSILTFFLSSPLLILMRIHDAVLHSSLHLLSCCTINLLLLRTRRLPFVLTHTKLSSPFLSSPRHNARISCNTCMLCYKRPEGYSGARIKFISSLPTLER